LIECLLGLLPARLDERHGRRLELLLPLALGGDLRHPFFVIDRREEVPIRGVGPAMETVEGNELDVSAASDAVAAEDARLV
jgi:hypothetical protein